MPPKRNAAANAIITAVFLYPGEEESIRIFVGYHIFPHLTFLCNLCTRFGEHGIKYEARAEEAAP